MKLKRVKETGKSLHENKTCKEKSKIYIRLICFKLINYLSLNLISNRF